MMRKMILSAGLFLCAGALGCFAQDKTQIQKYVERWAPTAVREMYRSGVPASITLAQGILESGAGVSSMATEGNNHFGIKCHKDWTGKRMYYDDDAKGECFRKYASADESFRDHSDFLRYRDRYKFLFEFETTDYKGWANGLKKAGYATDPGYAAKLIRYIEDNKLYEYDRMTAADAEGMTAGGGDGTAPEVSSGAAETSSGRGKVSRNAARKARRAKRRRRKNAEEAVPAAIPASPLSIEEPKPVDKGMLEEFRFSLSRQMLSRNGVPFITSVEGETYAGIAASNDLFLRELLRFNDLPAPERLLPGTIVYLQAKKNQAARGLEKYIVGEEPETLRDICQRFGVKMKSVCRMNGFTASYEPREGDTILLRGKKNSRLRVP